MDADFTGSSTEDRYFASLKTMDESLERLFESLGRARVLTDTLLFGAGDHGETPGALYKRLAALDAHILSVPLWVHVPTAPRFEAHLRGLRANLDRAVSVLDIVPTLRAFMDASAPPYTHEERSTCVVGRSLLDPLPTDRVVQGWQGEPVENANVGVLATADKALVYNAAHVEKSFVLEFRVDEKNPVRRRFERRLRALSEVERSGWRDAVARLNSSMVELRMPKLDSLLGGTVASGDARPVGACRRH